MSGELPSRGGYEAPKPSGEKKETKAESPKEFLKGADMSKISEAVLNYRRFCVFQRGKGVEQRKLPSASNINEVITKWSPEDQKLLMDVMNSPDKYAIPAATMKPAKAPAEPKPKAVMYRDKDGNLRTAETYVKSPDGAPIMVPKPVPVPKPKTTEAPKAPVAPITPDSPRAGAVPSGAETEPSKKPAETSTGESTRHEALKGLSADKKKMYRIGAAAAGAAVLLTLAFLGGRASGGDREPDTGTGTEASSEETPGSTESTEQKEDKEKLDVPTTRYNGKYASEDGTTYNPNKVGPLNFGERLVDGTEEEKRQDIIERIHDEPAVLATYFQDLQKHCSDDPLFQIEGSHFNTQAELMDAMEKDPELHQKVYDAMKEFIEGGSIEDDVLNPNGDKEYWNYYLDSGFETGDINTSEVEVVQYRDTKANIEVRRIRGMYIKPDGTVGYRVLTLKISCGGNDISEERDEHTREIKHDPEKTTTQEHKNLEEERKHANPEQNRKLDYTGDTPDWKQEDTDKDGVKDANEYKHEKRNDGSRAGKSENEKSADGEQTINEAVKKSDDKTKDEQESVTKEAEEERKVEDNQAEEQQKANDEQRQANEEAPTSVQPVTMEDLGL